MSKDDGNLWGLLISGGEAPEKELLQGLRKKTAFAVAADSGLDHALAAGISVDYWVGDGDSVKTKIEVPQKIFPRDKDYSDTQLALETLKTLGCQKIILAGASGGRLDHVFAIKDLFLLDQALVRWYTPLNECLRLDSGQDFVFEDLEECSFFCLEDEGYLESEGLQWPLDSLKFGRGIHSLSNRAKAPRVHIRVNKGTFLLIIARKFGCFRFLD